MTDFRADEFMEDEKMIDKILSLSTHLYERICKSSMLHEEAKTRTMEACARFASTNIASQIQSGSAPSQIVSSIDDLEVRSEAQKILQNMGEKIRWAISRQTDMPIDEANVSMVIETMTAFIATGIADGFLDRNKAKA